MDSSTSSLSQPVFADSSQNVQQKGNVEPGAPGNVSLYVTNLGARVTDSDLSELFSEHCKISSVKICRDPKTELSRGYGYVNLCSTLHNATEVMKSLNFKLLRDKHIRVMLSNRDPNLKSGGAIIFFKDFYISLGQINEIFSQFGAIITSELVIDNKGLSKGYGYVLFDQKEAAEAALELNNRVIDYTPVSVVPFICKEDRDRKKPHFQNYPTLYVENITSVVNDQEVEFAFREYGDIVHTHVARDSEGHVKGYGFVVFENFDDAVSAIKGLNGERPPKNKELDPLFYKQGHSVWYVGWACSMFKIKDRRLSGPEKERSGIPKKLKGADLYVKNFDDEMTGKKLKRLFSEFGMVLYSKAMLDCQGRKRGCGFVGFVTPEDATKAMNAMNGKIIGRKRLHVSVALRRKERKANLQVLREHCDGETIYTQLAPAEGLFESDATDFRHIPWYSLESGHTDMRHLPWTPQEAVDYSLFKDSKSDHIQEENAGEAVDHFLFKDSKSDLIQE